MWSVPLWVPSSSPITRRRNAAEEKLLFALPAASVRAGIAFSVLRADGPPQVNAGRNEWTAGLKVAGPQGETTFSPGTWNCTP